jgi:hypothetical protein
MEATWIAYINISWSCADPSPLRIKPIACEDMWICSKLTYTLMNLSALFSQELITKELTCSTLFWGKNGSKRRRGRRGKQLLDDFKGNGRNLNFKQKAVCYTGGLASEEDRTCHKTENAINIQLVIYKCFFGYIFPLIQRVLLSLAWTTEDKSKSVCWYV